MKMLQFIIIAMVLKNVLSQSLQPHSPRFSNEIVPSSIVEALTGRGTPQIPVPTTPLENIILCRNLASQIECAALAKLKRNALKRPVFGQIAGPLLEELAMICRCPACLRSNGVLPSNASLPPNQLAAVYNNPNILYVNPSAQNPNLNLLKFSNY